MVRSRGNCYIQSEGELVSEVGSVSKVRMSDLKCKANNPSYGEKHKLCFDLDATHTACYISRILGVSKRVALKYVNHDGKLTDKGIQTLHDINEELIRN